MSEFKRLGLKLVLWVADIMLEGELTAQQKEDLETLRISLSVTDFNEDG